MCFEVFGQLIAIVACHRGKGKIGIDVACIELGIGLLTGRELRKGRRIWSSILSAFVLHFE